MDKSSGSLITTAAVDVAKAKIASRSDNDIASHSDLIPTVLIKLPRSDSDIASHSDLTPMPLMNRRRSSMLASDQQAS